MYTNFSTTINHTLKLARIMSNPLMNDEGIRRIFSGDSVAKSANNNVGDEVRRTECECCGIIEECTADYIDHVKVSYCGKWVCGLCSAVVKEKVSSRTRRSSTSSITRASVLSTITMEEALCIHTELCQKFKKNTILNPHISLAKAMSDIAKRSSLERSSKNSPSSVITRSSSCFPSIGAGSSIKYL